MSQRPGRTLIPSVEIDLRAGRHRQLAHPPDRRDALALDEHDAVLERPAAVAVDEPPADEGERAAAGGGRLRLRCRRGGYCEGKERKRKCEAEASAHGAGECSAAP